MAYSQHMDPDSMSVVMAAVSAASGVPVGEILAVTIESHVGEPTMLHVERTKLIVPVTSELMNAVYEARLKEGV